MIKAVAFDYGGVVVLPDNSGFFEGGFEKGIANFLGVSEARFRDAYFQHNHLVNAANANRDDMFKKVLAVFNVNTKKEAEVMAQIRGRNSKMIRNDALIALFPKLQELGLKIGILSNSDSTLREQLNQNGIATLVDVVAISGEIGFQKPHKEAFDILFKKLGCKPEEVIFVDDSARSLEKAEEIGYIPILFRNNAQLKTDLITAGVPLS